MRRSDQTRFFPLIGLSMMMTVTGLCIWPALAQPQESGGAPGSQKVDGNAVLTSRGLTRVGNLYLLKSEIDNKDAIKEGHDALKQLEATGKTLQETIAKDQERVSIMDQELKTNQQERENLNAQKQKLNGQLAVVDDANSQTFIKNQMQQIDTQIRSRQDAIDRLNSSLTLAQTQLRNEQARFRELQAEYDSKKSAHDRRFAGVKAEYQPLKSDPEVVQALRQLNHSARPWVMIGPSWEYDSNVRSLAQGILSYAGLEVTYVTVSKRVGRRTQKVKVPKVSLAKTEKEVRAAGYQARLLQAKLSGPNGDANREAMSKAVAQLKKGISKINKAYAQFKQDGLITSAIEQVAPGAALEPSDDFKNYAKRLPDLEKALSTGN